MRCLIGLVGEKGAGKATFITLLKEFLPGDITIEALQFSDILGETLDQWGINRSRENLQLLAQVMNKAYGEGTLSRAMEKRISRSGADIVVIDGIRWMPDAELLRNYDRNLLIYVTASPEIRFQRLLARKEGKKVGEDTMSYEQFLKEEQAPNELLIAHIGNTADVKIMNESGTSFFREQVRACYQHSIAALL